MADQMVASLDILLADLLADHWVPYWGDGTAGVLVGVKAV